MSFMPKKSAFKNLGTLSPVVTRKAMNKTITDTLGPLRDLIAYPPSNLDALLTPPTFPTLSTRDQQEVAEPVTPSTSQSPPGDWSIYDDRPANLGQVQKTAPELSQQELDYLSGLTKQLEPPYYTGSQTQVYIGTTFLLNAVDCSWNESFEHTPYFGYRSQEYDHVFRGRRIVQGTLILNLMDNRLLDLVCDKAFPEQPQDRVFLDRTVADNGTASLPDQLTRYQAEAWDRLARIQDVRPPERLAINTLRWLESQTRFGVDVRINIGDPTEIGKSWQERQASSYEIIQGVIFTGENRTLQITPNVIAQAYSFFAKKVVRPGTA